MSHQPKGSGSSGPTSGDNQDPAQQKPELSHLKRSPGMGHALLEKQSILFSNLENKAALSTALLCYRNYSCTGYALALSPGYRFEKVSEKECVRK